MGTDFLDLGHGDSIFLIPNAFRIDEAKEKKIVFLGSLILKSAGRTPRGRI
jgi:hypothetical protein